jgi:hypothetical protein
MVLTLSSQPQRLELHERAVRRQIMLSIRQDGADEGFQDIFELRSGEGGSCLTDVIPPVLLLCYHPSSVSI